MPFCWFCHEVAQFMVLSLELQLEMQVRYGTVTLSKSNLS